MHEFHQWRGGVRYARSSSPYLATQPALNIHYKLSSDFTKSSRGGREGLMAKTSWPEVVGWPELNAADQINIDRPDVSVGFYMEGSPLPSGYDPLRVLIIVNASGVVIRTPVVG
ncbi:hypothetical protein D1007_30544 [Hordeum vulgare]|nr:hypothetical protein D1007_30544 [Hordeum vulgare]